MDRATAPFGRLLRQGRQQRGVTQLALALQAEVSTRHLSWLETGRALPSRAMVLRLAEQLAVPLRERNAWLQAAGYSPLFAERSLGDPGLAPARQAVQRLLTAHEPWPALAVDRHWNLVAHNRLIPPLMAQAAPELQKAPVNALRLSLHPRGLAPKIENLADWRAYVLARLARQAAAANDPVLEDLLAELTALGRPAQDEAAGAGHVATSLTISDVAVPLSLNTPYGRLHFITAVTVFGAPRDVTVSELAIETLLPADAATAEALRALCASLPAIETPPLPVESST
jgi:transcriptional regulator with XRE-family HTH domain